MRRRKTDMPGFAHNCIGCSPMHPAVVRAKTLDEALKFVAKGERVYVCTERVQAIFQVDKSIARDELARVRRLDRMPPVELHLGGSTFIG